MSQTRRICSRVILFHPLARIPDEKKKKYARQHMTSYYWSRDFALSLALLSQVRRRTYLAPRHPQRRQAKASGYFWTSEESSAICPVHSRERPRFRRCAVHGGSKVFSKGVMSRSINPDLQDYLNGRFGSTSEQEDYDHFDAKAFEESPCGIRGVDPAVKVVCPRRRYEEIIAMCGPDPVVRSRNLDSKCDLVEATIKIPERKFYEVVQADMYTRDEVSLTPNLLYIKAGTSATEKCFGIEMISPEQYLHFLGTEKVYNVLHTWKSSCENLQILEETCDSKNWLALTKAPPNHLQAGLDQRTFIRSELSGGVSMKEPPMDASAMEQHLEQRAIDYMTRRTQDLLSGGVSMKEPPMDESALEQHVDQRAIDYMTRRIQDLVISDDQIPGRSVDQCSSPQEDLEKWVKSSLDALGVKMYRRFSNIRDMNVSERGGDRDEAEPKITTELAESHEVVYKKWYGPAFCELRDIGSGSFGTVVVAQNKNDRILYAVKKVLIEPDDDRPIHKILQEGKVLAELSHDHVVAYKQSWVEKATQSDINRYSTETQSSQSSVASEDGSATEGAVGSTSGDTGESDVSRKEGIYSLLYIQMELCDESLFDKLYESPEAWVSDRENLFGTDAWKAEVLKILEQLLEALKYIHSEGIVHTDLKPGNILYDKKRKLYKLCDFGLATRYKRVVSSRDPTSGQTSSSLDLEKYSSPYEAPELLQGGSYSSKGDIYSLGVVLVELLCLFETPEKTDENLRMLRRGDTPSLLELYSTEVTDMVQIVICMCWTQPEGRPTAKVLLKSKLIVTKDTVIRALEDHLKEQDRRIFLLLRYIQHQERNVHLGNTESPRRRKSGMSKGHH